MKEIHIPAPPLPDSLPFTKQFDKMMQKASNILADSPPSKVVQKIEDHLPVFSGMDLPTPLGRVQSPSLNLPSLVPPKMDARRSDLFRAGIGTDIGAVLELIPGVGDFIEPIGNSISDTFRIKIFDKLTPEELPKFKNADKISPSTTLAVLQSFLGSK